jgi:hypothetical protein
MCVDATCPVSIEAKFWGSYAADPDTIYPVPPVSRIVVWNFSGGDSTFTVNSSPPDGILVDGAPDPSTVGITDCHPSLDNLGTKEAPTGPFYRCRVRGKASKFNVSYTLKFHDRAGSQRSLDPYVTNSGGPADGGAPGPERIATKAVDGPIVRIALSTTGALPDPVHIGTPQGDATVVVWAAPSGSRFDTDPFGPIADGVAFENATGTSRPPCRATSDADGMVEVEAGPFYRCTLWKNVSVVPTAYSAQFRTGNVVTTVRGSLN